MRAVVSGATGAVGMALLSELEGQGVETLVLCRKGSKRSDRIVEGRFIRKVECSLSDMKNFTLPENERYDVFYHLAWDGTTGASRNDMKLQNRNVEYALDALELAKRLGCGVFVGAGSQAEYGRVEGTLTPDTPAFPENGYGIAKLCAGQMCRRACEDSGIRFVWARILSVYGPFDTEGSMVMSTIAKLAAGERPSFTAGEQIWDYMYSADAARALYALAVNERARGVYCLGGGKADMLKNYIMAIRDTVAPKAEIGLGDIPYARGQVMYLKADISKLTADTGFTPSVSFSEGIRLTADWYLKNNEKSELR